MNGVEGGREGGRYTQPNLAGSNYHCTKVQEFVFVAKTCPTTGLTSSPIR